MQNPPNSPPVPPCDVAAEAQACVDEEINKQILLLCNLRARRNTFSLIFRLPPETLANIFIHGARDYHEKEYSLTTWGVPSWVNVSRVCRHWRDVALNCSTLWTYHFVASERWTDELLARSKHASLKICIYFPSMRSSIRWWSNLVEKVMNHVEHIQELRLDLPAETLSTKLPLPLHAPRLRDLEIAVRHHAPEGSWPPALFDGGTPALRTLKLSDCPVPWYSLQQNGLTTLSLHRVPPRIRQNMVEFCAILIHMQDLTDLHLLDALASARDLLSGGVFDVSQNINLPRLARLSVAAPVSTVVALLSCVNIPLKTEIRLKFQSEYNSSIDDYASIPSILAQRLSISEDSASSSSTIRSLVIESTSQGPRLIFSALEHDFDSRSPYAQDDSWGCNIPLKITVGMNPSVVESDRNRLTSDICCSIPLTNVESLHSKNPPFSPDFWRKILGHLQGLRFMKLSYGHMPDLASVLSFSADELVENPSGPITGDRDPTRHLLAPALEELEFRFITFSCESNPSELAISESALREALSTREALRERLTMIDCRVDYGYDESDVESDTEFCDCCYCDHDSDNSDMDSSGEYYDF